MLPREEVLQEVERIRATRLAAGAPLVSELKALLPIASRLLRDRFGATKVLLFGSFAQGTPTPRSDVDLAVEGMDPRDQFRAMGALAELLHRHVDLVILEDLAPELRDRLLRGAEPA